MDPISIDEVRIWLGVFKQHKLPGDEMLEFMVAEINSERVTYQEYTDPKIKQRRETRRALKKEIGDQIGSLSANLGLIRQQYLIDRQNVFITREKSDHKFMQEPYTREIENTDSMLQSLAEGSKIFKRMPAKKKAADWHPSALAFWGMLQYVFDGADTTPIGKRHDSPSVTFISHALQRIGAPQKLDTISRCLKDNREEFEEWVEFARMAYHNRGKLTAK